jgi:hypothetical protein
MSRIVLSCALLLLLVLSPTSALAVEFPPTLKVGEVKLDLNGAGVREKYFLDLYEAGLYLAQPSHDAATIINADTPMVIHIVITSKLVSQAKLLDSLQEGFQNSTQGKTETIGGEIEQFRQCFAGEIARGTVFDLVYAPGQGVGVFKNGKKQGLIPGLAFKRALFGIWLGERPADVPLRQALLGSVPNTRSK